MVVTSYASLPFIGMVMVNVKPLTNGNGRIVQLIENNGIILGQTRNSAGSIMPMFGFDFSQGTAIGWLLRERRSLGI